MALRTTHNLRIIRGDCLSFFDDDDNAFSRFFLNPAQGRAIRDAPDPATRRAAAASLRLAVSSTSSDVVAAFAAEYYGDIPHPWAATHGYMLPRLSPLPFSQAEIADTPSE